MCVSYALAAKLSDIAKRGHISQVSDCSGLFLKANEVVADLFRFIHVKTMTERSFI